MSGNFDKVQIEQKMSLVVVINRVQWYHCVLWVWIYINISKINEHSWGELEKRRENI